MTKVNGQFDLDLPCQIPWDQMHGDDRVRFCSQCNLHVHNLSVMTAEEAAEFVANREERICVAYLKRVDDGTPVFAEFEQSSPTNPRSLTVLPYRTPPRGPRRRWLVPTAIAGAVATAGAAMAFKPDAAKPPALALKPAPIPVTMVAGGLSAPPGPSQLDPRTKVMAGDCEPKTAKFMRSALSNDAIAKSVLNALPKGYDIVETDYNVYPPGYRSCPGQVFFIGKHAGENPDDPPIKGFVWVLPKGARKAKSSSSAELQIVNPSTLKPLFSTKSQDVFADVDNAALLKSLLHAHAPRK